MPIRMTDDPNQGQSGNDPGRKRPSGGGGNNPLVYLIPKILGAVFKYPKLAIPVILIGGVFLYFKGGCNLENVVNNESVSSIFSKGAELNQEVYDKAEVFENLYADNTKNPLPESVSLIEYCPKRLNQGQQGSCVAWSSAYAARTILEARSSGKNPDQVKFSPAYLYNQIKLEGCQGAYLQNAMEAMKKNGGLPFSEFPYTDESCSKLPSSNEMKKARDFNIKGAQRLTLDGENYRVNMLAIKQNLAQGSPVVIGMRVGGSFMQDMAGKDLWAPRESDYDMNGFGGHAMCVIGYDDNKSGGAFQIMNSWGNDWGNKGIAWVRYSDFDYFVVEAFGLYPMGNANEPSAKTFKVDFGIVEVDAKNKITNYIPLELKSDNVFETRNTLIKKKTRFKIEVTNTIECYTYIFGEETDGSSYVLFPYTPKHSPYCGITGTRLFPNAQSMQPDEIGNRDVFAIVVSKNPLDYVALNQKINKSKKRGLQVKINDALGDKVIRNVDFSEGKTFGFETAIRGSETAVVMEIQVTKK
ncbi:MAG: C1 family peptidase [Flavobacteriales bacterium]|nr:C1 family peptidase [Flavobacteriales bacterium]